MSFHLSKRSQENLDGTHPDIRRVVYRALEITEVDFAVTDGIRTLEEQQKHFASGASHTMRSRHLTGHAVDLAAYLGGKISWAWPLYYKIAKSMYAAAHELGIDLEWGGEWEGDEQDGPHFQLSWKEYPDGSNTNSEDGI